METHHNGPYIPEEPSRMTTEVDDSFALYEYRTKITLLALMADVGGLNVVNSSLQTFSNRLNTD